MTLPAIRILQGPSPSQTAVADAGTMGLSSLWGAASHAVDLMPHQRDDLRVFLINRAAIMKMAQRRAGNMLGRLYNSMAGDDPEYVTLSGTHLTQTLQVAGRQVPDCVVPSGEYKLRGDIVAQAIEHLKER